MVLQPIGADTVTGALPPPVETRIASRAAQAIETALVALRAGAPEGLNSFAELAAFLLAHGHSIDDITGLEAALADMATQEQLQAAIDNITGVGGGGGASSSILFGWSGAFIPNAERDFAATWMNRTSWTDLRQGHYLGNNDDFTPWIQANPTKACNIGTPLIPHDSGGNLNDLLDQAIAGQHDDDYRGLGEALAYWGNKTVYARLFWEFNIRNGSNAPGDVMDRAKFRAAWRRAVPLMREGFAALPANDYPTGQRPAGQELFIDFSPLSDGADYRPFYPGDDVVDVISMDVYPTIYGSTTPTEAALLASVNAYLDDIAAFADEHNKPVALGEFSAWQQRPDNGVVDSRGRGDFPPYIDAVFDWAEKRDALYLSYYNIADNTGLILADVPNTLDRLQDRVAALDAATPDPAPIGAAPVAVSAAFNTVDAARTGFITGQLVASASLSEADYQSLLQSYATLDPNLVWICLGANDYLTDNGGATPAGVATMVSRLVDDLRALPSAPSVLLALPHNLVGHENTGRTWAAHRTALQGVATNKGTGLFDIATVIPTANSGSPLLRADGLHYSDTGHQAIADALQTYLTGLLTSRPTWAKAWLAAQTQASATLLALGDSLTEGQGASTRAKRWLDRGAVGYRTAHGLPAPTLTHVPPRYGVYGPDSPWGVSTSASTGGSFNEDFTPALGRRTLELDANSTTTFSVVGASAEVWISSSQALTYQVDNRPALPLPGYYSGGLGGVQRVVLPLGFPGAHTIKITNGNARYTYLAGITASSDPASSGAASGGGAGSVTKAVRLFASADQNSANAQQINKTLGGVSYNDDEAVFDLTIPNRIKVLVPGRFLIASSAYFRGGNTGERVGAIMPNRPASGSLPMSLFEYGTVGVVARPAGTDLHRLVAGDTLALDVYTDGGADCSMPAGANGTYLTVTYLGA